MNRYKAHLEQEFRNEHSRVLRTVLLKEESVKPNSNLEAYENEFTDKEIENILKVVDEPFEEISFEELCKL